jgi:hypothetical protein
MSRWGSRTPASRAAWSRAWRSSRSNASSPSTSRAWSGATGPRPSSRRSSSTRMWWGPGSPTTTRRPGSPTVIDRQRFVREATDYPYTDFTKISIVTDPPGLVQRTQIFSSTQRRTETRSQSIGAPDAVERYPLPPRGRRAVHARPAQRLRHAELLQGLDDALADRRVASDPWLAPNEPTFTGRFDRNLPVSFHDSRIFSDVAGRLSNGVSQERAVLSRQPRLGADLQPLARRAERQPLEPAEQLRRRERAGPRRPAAPADEREPHAADRRAGHLPPARDRPPAHRSAGRRRARPASSGSTRSPRTPTRAPSRSRTPPRGGR